MGELLAKIINEDAKRKETREFKIVKANGIQYLVLIDGYGVELNRVKLDANSPCAECSYFAGACACNCSAIG